MEAGGEDIRCLVMVMRRCFAPPKRVRSNLHQGGTAQVVRITRRERETAMRAARAFGLNMAGVDLLRSDDGPMGLEVGRHPDSKASRRPPARNWSIACTTRSTRCVGPRRG